MVQQGLENFQRWFNYSLDPLRANADAGFVFVFVAFPLLERYLRRKAKCNDKSYLNKDFYTRLGLIFEGIKGKEKEFWSSYRNGLLHQASFAREMRCNENQKWIILPDSRISGHSEKPVYYNGNENCFYLNPVEFHRSVISKIECDYSQYELAEENYTPTPYLLSPDTRITSVVPTIGIQEPKK